MREGARPRQGLRRGTCRSWEQAPRAPGAPCPSSAFILTLLTLARLGSTDGETEARGRWRDCRLTGRGKGPSVPGEPRAALEGDGPRRRWPSTPAGERLREGFEAQPAAVPGHFRSPARGRLGLVVLRRTPSAAWRSSGGHWLARGAGADGTGGGRSRGVRSERERSSRDVWVPAPPLAPPLPPRASGARPRSTPAQVRWRVRAGGARQGQEGPTGTARGPRRGNAGVGSRAGRAGPAGAGAGRGGGASAGGAGCREGAWPSGRGLGGRAGWTGAGRTGGPGAVRLRPPGRVCWIHLRAHARVSLWSQFPLVGRKGRPRGRPVRAFVTYEVPPRSECGSSRPSSLQVTRCVLAPGEPGGGSCRGWGAHSLLRGAGLCLRHPAW